MLNLLYRIIRLKNIDTSLLPIIILNLYSKLVENMILYVMIGKAWMQKKLEIASCQMVLYLHATCVNDIKINVIDYVYLFKS